MHAPFLIAFCTASHIIAVAGCSSTTGHLGVQSDSDSESEIVKKVKKMAISREPSGKMPNKTRCDEVKSKLQELNKNELLSTLNRLKEILN